MPQQGEDLGRISAQSGVCEHAELWRQQLRHDLRQPLMTAALMLDAVASTSEPDSDLLRRLSVIQNQLEWMQLLLQAQAGAPAGSVVDIAETIASHCTHGSSGRPVRLLCLEPAYTRVDPVELTRAARNLLDNASRAAGRAGTVEVTVNRAADTALLEVADDGPGFGRIEPNKGLGLPSVRRFAERYGGGLDITRSRLGGTAVTLHLPLAPAPSAA